jgi:hypothetical protein
MAGCRGSLCCCCRWCCCCVERETRTPEELVRSRQGRAGEGAVAKGRREALPGVGPSATAPAGGRGWGLGTSAWALEASALLRVPGLRSFLITPPWNLSASTCQFQLILSLFFLFPS